MKFNTYYAFCKSSICQVTEICDNCCLLMSINFELKQLLKAERVKYCIIAKR